MSHESLVCTLCGSHRVSGLPYTLMYGGGTVRIFRCRNCNLGFLHPMPSPEEVISFYTEEYFQCDYHCGTSAGTYTDEVENMRAAMRLRLFDISRFAKRGKYLEIGCAGGAALAEARAFGFDTIGVELSAPMAEWGRKELGLDIRQGTLRDQNFPDASFDAVFMGDVIEHLREPQRELLEISRIVKPGGVLVVEYPMELNHLAARARSALHREKVQHRNPYHLYFYTPAPLGLLLEKSGFQPVFHKTSKMVRRKPIPVFLLDAFNAAVTAMTGKWGDRGFSIGIRK